MLWIPGLRRADHQEKRMADSMQIGICYWLTGLPGSGKTTLAGAFKERLRWEGQAACILDADLLREGINRDLGYSPEDRSENVRRISEVARLFVLEGFVVIVACIAPYRADRERARGRFPESRFFEVFVDAPVEVCIARDPKGLYLKARQGATLQVTGVSAPYERPEQPDLVLMTGALSLDTCVEALLRGIRSIAPT
ncbi:MAG: adenylyl-sulfate kinase [Roseateles sp.]|uniref:adenylyl-sulfate kinase n=1 Tax=Roseateles sp. TaxID=1971397 RepID=UPI004034FDB5